MIFLFSRAGHGIPQFELTICNFDDERNTTLLYSTAGDNTFIH